MRTRSQSRNRQQQQVPQTFFEPFDLEEPIDNPAPPVVTMTDNRTMTQLLEAPTEGYEDAINVPEITATNFELNHGLLTLVQNKQFFGHGKEDPHAHIRYFNKITSTMKFPNVLSTMALSRYTVVLTSPSRVRRLYFPPSMVTKLRNDITNFRQEPDESLFEAWERYKLSIDRCPNHNMLPVTQIDTFYNGLTMRHRDTINAAAGGTFMKRRPEECYDLIENMTAHHNDWDTSAQRSESSSSITSSNPEIVALKLEMAEINKNLMKVLQTNQQVKAVTPSCETCGGPHAYNDCPATVGQTQNVYAAGAYNQGGNSYQPQGATNSEFSNYMKANDAILRNMQTNMTSLTNSNLELKNMFSQFMKMNTASTSGSGTLPSNTVTNPREDLKGITTRSGVAYQGPTIPTTSSSPPKVLKHETEVTKDVGNYILVDKTKHE
ncbi:reverse transcriptase domain-containing protein [Tanacetum coccineum]